MATKSATVTEATSAEKEKPAPCRVHNKEFFRGVVARVHLPEEVISEVYQAMIEEMLEIFGRGEYLVLRGLGLFYPQIHRGHQVQFAKDKSKIDNYAVMKFSSKRDVNKRLGEALERNGIGIDDL